MKLGKLNEQCKRNTASCINVDDDSKEEAHQMEFNEQVTVTIGRTQALQSVDLDQENTIVHVKVWNEYLQLRRTLGQSCPAYRKFRSGCKEWQKSQRTILQVQGRSVEVIGPFPIHVQLDAVIILTLTYVTTDEEFHTTNSS